MSGNGWLWLAALDLLLMLSFGITAVLGLRRRGRGAEVPEQVTGTFEDRLATLVPRRPARLLLFEVHGWHALVRLPARWQRPAGPAEFPYASGLRLLMAVLLGLTLVELPVFALLAALLLPWLAARVGLLVLGLYAVWFMASTWAGMVTSPHLVQDGRLLLRAGLLAGIVIPLEDIAAVQPRRQSWNALFGPLLNDGVAAFPVNGSTELELRLRRPAILWRLLGSDLPAEIVHVHADDADRMLEILRRHLEPDQWISPPPARRGEVGRGTHHC
ncbi:MAG: hypothetical protein M3072_15995 [Candidatus Dormibacteraeota bacterium]|nr:hypothetical protein [Candidatus Dormibacteraeota bacterium]